MTPKYQWKQLRQKSLTKIISTYSRFCCFTRRWYALGFYVIAISLLRRLFLLSPLFRLKSIKGNVCDVLKRFNSETLNCPQLYWECSIAHFHQILNWQVLLQFLICFGASRYFFQLFGLHKVNFLSHDEVGSLT